MSSSYPGCLSGSCSLVIDFNPRSHPHSTYAQKSPKLNPPPPLYAIVRICLDPSPPLLCVRTMWMTSMENKVCQTRNYVWSYWIIDSYKMFWSQKFTENIIIFVVYNKDGKHVANKDDLDDELKPNFFTIYKVFDYIM